MGKEETGDLLTVDKVLSHLSGEQGEIAKLLVVAEYRKRDDGEPRGAKVIWTQTDTTPEWVMSAVGLAQWRIFEYMSSYQTALAMAKAYADTALLAAPASPAGLH